jgi:hypothetical protein
VKIELEASTWLKPLKVYHLRDQTSGQGGPWHPVLYVDVDFNRPRKEWPKPKNPKDWTPLYHQTAGHACLHHNMLVRFLKPKKDFLALCQKLGEAFDDSCLWSPPPWTSACLYQKILGEHRLHAEREYHKLEEGFYPLDLECLPKVTSEKINVGTLFPKPKGKKGWWRFWGTTPHLAILGPNCD